MTTNIKETLKLFHDPREVNEYFDELSKMLNIAKNSYLATRTLIINNDNIHNNDKNKMLLMLDSLYQRKPNQLPTTDYNDKPYTQLFFEEFLDFLKSTNLKMNEFKVVLAIYEILNHSNTYGNVLINASNKLLSEKTGIAYSNINKDIKSLVNKNILIKDENGSLYLNCQYFFRGTKKDYDIYSDLYTELKTQPQQITQQNNDNFELPFND